jgi:hypothetical protein
MAMSCRDMETVAGCLIAPPALPRPIVIHYEYQEAASGNPIVKSVRYTDAAGVIVSVPAGGTVTPGVCPIVNTTVEDLLMCDDADANPATPSVPFLRKFTRTFNTADGSLISQTIADFKVDGVTPYVISAAANVSTKCTDSYAFEETTVCDANGTTFIRRQTQINGVFVTLGFFNPGTNVAGTPVGAVGSCPSCGPATASGILTTWG